MKKYLLPAIILVVIVAAGVKRHQEQWDPNDLAATVYTHPQTLPDFNLVDDQENTFSLKNFKDQWNLVFFGFSHCPGLCPTTLAQLNKVIQQSPKDNRPQVVFITIDPARDTAKRLHEYLPRFNPHFVGVTGSEKELDRLKESMGVLAMAPSATDKEGHYNIDHSGSIMVIDPKGHLYALFTTPHNVDVIASEVALLQQHYRG